MNEEGKKNDIRRARWFANVLRFSGDPTDLNDNWEFKGGFNLFMSGAH